MSAESLGHDVDDSLDEQEQNGSPILAAAPEVVTDPTLTPDEFERLRFLEKGCDVTFEGRRYFITREKDKGKSHFYNLLDADTYNDLGYIEIQNCNGGDSNAQLVKFTSSLGHDWLKAFFNKYQEVVEKFNPPDLDLSEMEFLNNLGVYPSVLFRGTTYTTRFSHYPDGSNLFRANRGPGMLLGFRFNPRTGKFLYPPYPSVELLKEFIRAIPEAERKKRVALVRSQPIKKNGQ